MPKTKLKSSSTTGEPAEKKKMSATVSKTSSTSQPHKNHTAEICPVCDDYPKETYKSFHDPIHKHIELHPLLAQVINTPQFQRLRNIKQLGGNYFLFPGASHNRFEHSIGTCHLAGELVRHLRDSAPERKINKEDVLCVELAGLCHDLGHGPFSHMYDNIFLSKMKEKGKSIKNKEHEKRSCLMFDRLLQENQKVRKEFEKLLRPDGDGSEVTQCRNAIFIKELINGPIPEVDPQKNQSKDTWKYKGRKQDKGFLYQIVANKTNGVDVDKWDYFARDCHQLGIANSFDHIRFMKNMKVLDCTKINGKEKEEKKDYQICVRDKECKNLYEMFHTRDALHRRAYQHRISTAVEDMITDAMVLVNDYVKFEGKAGKKFTLAESADDMEAFEKISDHVIYNMYYSSDSKDAEVEEREARSKARSIMERVLIHDFYVYIGSIKIKDKTLEEAKTKKEVVDNWMKDEEEKFRQKFKDLEDHLVVPLKRAKFHYGKKTRNPVDDYLFFSKAKPGTLPEPKRMKREDISHMLPKHFMDVELQVYCKSKEKAEDVKQRFDKWLS